VVAYCFACLEICIALLPVECRLGDTIDGGTTCVAGIAFSRRDCELRTISGDRLEGALVVDLAGWQNAPGCGHAEFAALKRRKIVQNCEVRTFVAQDGALPTGPVVVSAG